MQPGGNSDSDRHLYTNRKNKRMSDPHPIDDAARVLKELEKETLGRLSAMEESTESPVMNSAVGRLSYIDAYQQEQMSLHGQRQLRSQLASIRAALERVKAGTYGICVSCRVAIPPERLEYMPEAPFCVSCNESRRR